MSEHWLQTDALQKRSNPHIVIAMSGGVDSSVAALKIKEAGFRCSALFIKSWEEERTGNEPCRWEEDVADAMSVCEQLGIPINTVDLTEDYWNLVFKEFLVEISKGRTPNPDILCNKEIKFSAFKKEAKKLGGDVVATGHYAQIEQKNAAVQLRKASDSSKDQSYFLHALNQEQLRDVIFPLGNLVKSEVRDTAKTYRLRNHKKKDSTGICFIGEKPFQTFLSQFLIQSNGPIVDTEDRIIGKHQGVIFYTIGQRKGLGIGGLHDSEEHPWYVVEKNLTENKLVVAQGHNHPALLSRLLVANNPSWILDPPEVFPFRCKAKTRYRQADQPCIVRKNTNAELEVLFDNTQRAITPGQSIVFYSGDICLGGAIIDRKEN